MLRNKLLILVLLLLPYCFYGQQQGYTNYWRFTFEDDIFKPFLRKQGSIDRYYTTGLKLEHYSDNPAKKWIEKIMPFSANDDYKAISYGIGSNMYTPSKLSSQKVDSSDRPYAGWLYASTRGVFSRFGEHSRRVTIDYSAGLLGPPSLQKQLQRGFHRLINPIIPSTMPEGWDNQISTALAINTNMQYEFSWLHSKNLGALITAQEPIVEFFPSFELNAGTVMNFLKAGTVLSFQTGGGPSYFATGTVFNAINPNFVAPANTNTANIVTRRKTYLNVYLKPSVTLLAYNSMLSGGIVSFERSKYVLQNSDVRHIVGQIDAGVMVKFNKFGFLYTCTYRTQEFKGALPAFWGGISILFLFRNHY